MKPLHMFFLDDDREDLDLVTEVAESYGHTVKLFSQPAELFDFLDLHGIAPDLIFIDIYMPRDDGYQVLERLKTFSELDNTPVVIYTGECDEICIDKCFALGTSYHIRKATSFSWLQTTLQRMFDVNWLLHVPVRNQFLLEQ